MTSRSRVFVVFAALCLAAAPLLASTKFVHRWVLTGVAIPQLHKMLVAAVMENYIVRQEFEDTMKAQLAKYGVEGVPSYMVLPPKNEMMEGELRQRIKESTLDSVLVVRPKAVRTESEEVVTGGVYVPPPGYYSFWPYWNTVMGTYVPTSSYTKENVIVRVEVNLYNTKTEKLVWNGETDTVYSKDFEKLGKNYAKALIDQLKKDKILKKK